MKEKTAAVLDSFGKTVELPERLMDVLTGVSGCAPAWIFCADRGDGGRCSCGRHAAQPGI